ncbi:hypothetical protein SOPP22_13860 [Shewanella sp. OPT22]|nr:hypothetical protein SOPP22_13860 [Shewanella sp. OPT22]
MDKHRKLVGTLFILLGSVIMLAVSVMLTYNYLLGHLDNVIWNLIFIPISVSIMFSGHFLLKNKVQFYPYIIWVAVMNLIIVPIGPLISIYYFWFHYKYIRTQV